MERAHNREAFETTHWSMIQAAANENVSRYRDAMQQLSQRYWFPLYAFARRNGNDADQAQDLIQAFFLRLMEKDVLRKADRQRGRFRNFLLASLKNFLANEAAKGSAQRRGGSRQIQSLDFRDAEGRLAHEAVDHLTAEAAFHRQWALEVLSRTLGRLEAEFQLEGKGDLFEALRAYLTADSVHLPYAEVAEQLGMTADAVKVNVHRMRHRYRRHLESEIVDTLALSADAEEEIQLLFRALRDPNRE